MKLLTKAPARMLKIMVVVLVAVVFVAFFLRGSMASLEFGNDITKDAAAKSILADRAKTIEQLQDVVKQDVDNPEKKKPAETAMILLGALRADEAAPLLASHLLFQRKDIGVGLRLHSFDENYPAVGALVRIGVPALDTLVYQASTTDDRGADDMTNYVLVSVLGKRPAIAFLADIIQDRREQDQKQRLDILMTKLQKYPAIRRQSSYP